MRPKKIKNNLKSFDVLFLGYTLITGVVVIFFNRGLKSPYLYSILHFAVAAAVYYFIPVISKSKNKVLQFIRWWYPIILFTFNYREADRFTGIITDRWYDGVILTFEKNLFGVHPTVWLQKFISPVVTEFMKFNYFTYYLMIPVAGVALYFFKNNKKYYTRFLTSVCMAFYISYIAFIIVPVRGPRYELYDRYKKDYTVNIGKYYGPNVAADMKDRQTKALDGYFFTGLQDLIMKYGSMHGGCMPSSHIAVAFVSMVMMGFYVRKLFYIYLPSVAILCISVVYNRYHYVSDVAAGILIGILSIFLSDIFIKKFFRWRSKKF